MGSKRASKESKSWTKNFNSGLKLVQYKSYIFYGPALTLKYYCLLTCLLAWINERLRHARMSALKKCWKWNASVVRCYTLTWFNLSLSCGDYFWNWTWRHLFWCALAPTARCTWLYDNIPVSQCWIFRALPVFYFFDFMLFFVFLSCIPIMVIVVPSQKLNGHQAF